MDLGIHGVGAGLFLPRISSLWIPRLEYISSWPLPKQDFFLFTFLCSVTKHDFQPYDRYTVVLVHSFHLNSYLINVYKLVKFCFWLFKTLKTSPHPVLVFPSHLSPKAQCRLVLLFVYYLLSLLLSVQPMRAKSITSSGLTVHSVSRRGPCTGLCAADLGKH